MGIGEREVADSEMGRGVGWGCEGGGESGRIGEGLGSLALSVGGEGGGLGYGVVSDGGGDGAVGGSRWVGGGHWLCCGDGRCGGSGE